jgi:hypothetical protein
MVSADTKAVIERAKRIYAEQLRAVLEPHHRDRFVAIEPESGEYFLGDTFDEAVKSAQAKHPSRLSHTIRIGHRAALHLGGIGFSRRAGQSRHNFGKTQRRPARSAAKTR